MFKLKNERFKYNLAYRYIKIQNRILNSRKFLVGKLKGLIKKYVVFLDPPKN